MNLSQDVIKINIELAPKGSILPALFTGLIIAIINRGDGGCYSFRKNVTQTLHVLREEKEMNKRWRGGSFIPIIIINKSHLMG